MAQRNEIEAKRRDLIQKAQELLGRKVKSMQFSFYQSLADVVDQLHTDAANTIEFSPRNMAKLKKVTLQITQEARRQNPTFIQWIIQKALEVTGLNKMYFSTFTSYPDTVDDLVAKRVMLGLGYDIRKGQLIPGGWLDQISDLTPVAQQAASDISKAISSKMPLDKFKKTFRATFTAPPSQGGMGYLERHYSTFVFDLFQAVDRQTQNQYAEDLGLKYAVYSGTVMDRTRPFCKARVGHVYTSQEIDSWASLNFRGKFKNGYVPRLHLGGHNCRHQLNWITEELLERMGGEEIVNKYN